MENIITEFKVIETDDGFRIEIKGDKEKIKEFMGGMRGHRGWHRGHRRGAWGGFPFNPMMWMNMAPWWGAWEDEEDEPDETKDA